MFLLYIFDKYIPRNQEYLLNYHQKIPNYIHLCLEVLNCVFLYDFIMFILHYLQHNFSKYLPSSLIKKNKKLINFLKSIHYEHHGFKQTLFIENVIQFDFIDAWTQLLVNVFIQNSFFLGIYKKHALSRILHNIIVISLLCESHSGYNFNFMSHNMYPNIFAGPINHVVTNLLCEV